MMDFGFGILIALGFILAGIIVLHIDHAIRINAVLRWLENREYENGQK